MSSPSTPNPVHALHADRPSNPDMLKLASDSGLLTTSVPPKLTDLAEGNLGAFVINYSHALFNAIDFNHEKAQEALAAADAEDQAKHLTTFANKLAERAAALGFDITMMPHTIQGGQRQIAVTVAKAGSGT